MADKVYDRPMIGQGVVLSAATSAAPATAFGATPTGAPTTVALSWIKDIKEDWSMGVLEWGNLAQAFKRRMATVFDGGELTGSLQFLPGDTSNKTLYGLLKSGTIVYWEVLFPDTSKVGFNGLVSKLGPSEAQEEEIDADFTVSVDGDVIVIPVVGP